MKQEIIATIGISNSGKTTWAEETVKTNPQYINVNRDDARVLLFCEGDSRKLPYYKFTKGKENEVTEHCHTLIKDSIVLGKSVIVSDTNLSEKTRISLKELANSLNVPLKFVHFDVDVEECLERNRKRPYSVPEKVIIQQAATMRAYLKKPVASVTEGLPDAIIVDIDGTVADMTGIRGPYELTKVITDKPKENVIRYVKELSKQGNEIIFMSGREDYCREDTIKWLDMFVGVDYKLFMRTSGDSRRDSIVKEELYFEHVDNHYNVKLCIDDRDQVVRKWRALGLECWQVAYGDF